jgi:hypothetical protein
LYQVLKIRTIYIPNNIRIRRISLIRIIRLVDAENARPVEQLLENSVSATLATVRESPTCVVLDLLPVPDPDPVPDQLVLRLVELAELRIRSHLEPVDIPLWLRLISIRMMVRILRKQSMV